MRQALRRMAGWLDSLGVRTTLLVLVAIGVLHLLSLWTYQHALHRQAMEAGDARLADQILSIRRAVMREPFEARETVAHQLSGGHLEAHWSRVEHAAAGGEGAAEWQPLAARLREQAPELGEGDLVVGANRKAADDPHLAVISIRLPDGSWVNVSLLRPATLVEDRQGTLLSTTLMALGAVFVTLLAARWLARPLASFATAAKGFSGAGAPVVLPEQGPREVRELAMAFNDMQQRITRLISDRTLALAAVSHDLKTPITRLRFRAEALADPAARAAIVADLADMEGMLDQTLAYLRGDVDTEEARPLDLVAIIETIVDDFQDHGAAVTLAGAGAAVVTGRRLALKRAFVNLIDNAVKYGGRADVSVEAGREVTVRIADRGPGIPVADIGRALEPFVRLDPARNRQTGGFGLGLTVALRTIQSHGGRLELANAPSGGLVATVHLPKAATARA